MSSSSYRLSSRTICLLIASSGFATLSWEVIWQIKATLTLGASAFGTAITLAVMMGGMSVGSFLMGKALQKSTRMQPMHIYGLLELIAGLCGLLLNPAFLCLEKFDSTVYSSIPSLISFVSITGIIIILGMPTLCMGATLPVLNLIAKQINVSITKLYSLNTIGAAVSVLIVAFVLIPLFGIAHTIWSIASINIFISFAAWLITKNKMIHLKYPHEDAAVFHQPLTAKIFFIIFVTGFATFTLEIAWFRSITSMLPGTTDVFAIILACVLIALGLAAKNVARLKQRQRLLGSQLCLAGIFIFLLTPLLERLDSPFAYSKKIQTSAMNISLTAGAGFDALVNQDTLLISGVAVSIYIFSILLRFSLAYLIIVPPIRYLGTAFPWLLENTLTPYQTGKLYAVNTLAAIIGSLSAAWVLLPAFGFTKTAWLAGVLVVIAGIVMLPGNIKRLSFALASGVSLLFAMHFETGIGKTRVQGLHATDYAGQPAKLLEFFNGPDATAAAVEYRDGSRILLINSIAATWESGHKIRRSIHYMAWMGYLPMILHPDPEKALVICFGTGQTANAVRKENPKELDIVDVNPDVFKLAHNFKSNENVLNDHRVKAITMDGRAYLRRANKIYDVITLEPMPPSLSGVNALYSKEFYLLARNKLSRDGVIAQWLPFQVVAPHYTASIAKTFREVFPNAVLWIDQDSKMGILLGSKNDNADLTMSWPGLTRINSSRDLSSEQIQSSIALNALQLKQYSQYGEIITDDNQLLAYGKALYANNLTWQNFVLLRRVNNKIGMPVIDRDYR